MEIIDAHVHLFRNRETGQKAMRDQSPTGYWGTLEELREVLNSAGVSRAAAVATVPLRAMAEAAFERASESEASDPEIQGQILERMRERLSRYNAWLCEKCSAEGSLWAFVHADPFVGMDALLEEVETRVDHDGAQGLKLHPMLGHYYPDDLALWPLYEFAQGKDIPLVFHGGRSLESPDVQYAHPERFKNLLLAFPRLRVVVAHLGSDFWETTAELAESFENVFFDTSIAVSGLTDPPLLSDQEALQLIHTIGTHKVLFASDFPWGTAAEDLKRIQRLGLADGELEAILGKNAGRVLGGEG